MSKPIPYTQRRPPRVPPTWSQQVGKTFRFYGVDFNKFKLDQQVWEAREDENDGYRSALDDMAPWYGEGLFFKVPLATVQVVEIEERGEYSDSYDNFQGFVLLDVEHNHIWLRVGTRNFNDYYPSFTVEYTPRPPDPPPAEEEWETAMNNPSLTA